MSEHPATAAPGTDDPGTHDPGAHDPGMGRPKSDALLETAMLVSTAASLLGMSAISPALPEIHQSFAATPNSAYLVKMVVSAVGIAMVIFSPLTGLAFRLLGRRPTLVAAYAVFVVAGVGGLWLPTLWGVIASRFLVGVASALIVTSGITLIAEYHEGRPRELRIGVNHGIGTLAAGLLIPVAGWLAHQDWRLAGLVYLAGVPALLAVLFSPALGRTPPATAAAEKAGRAAIPRAALVFLPVALISGSIAFTIQVFLPYRVADLGAPDPAFTGLIFSFSMICSVLTSFLYAPIRRKLSPPAIFAVTFSGWIIAFSLLALAQARWQMALAMVFIGIPGGLLGPNIFSVAARLAGDAARVRVIGFAKALYYFGPFVGPTLLLPVEKAYGASGAFLALCAAAAAMAMGALTMSLRRGPAPALAAAP
jgi:MFS family permease